MPPHVEGDDGLALLELARQRGLEGIVAKRLDSPYQPGGRSRDWVKVKLRLRQELVVGGWLPGAGALAGQIGSLLVGYHDQGRFRFAGAVGSDARMVRLLMAQALALSGGHEGALQQLKAIFGGMPTEGERKILLELQASADKPDAVRQEILKRAAALAENRLKFNEQRAAELRGGSYYKPQGGAPKPQAPAAPSQGNGADTMLQHARDALAQGAPRDLQ